MKRQAGGSAEEGDGEPAALRRRLEAQEQVGAVRVKQEPVDGPAWSPAPQAPASLELGAAAGLEPFSAAAACAVRPKVEEVDGSYDCLICSESVRGTEARRCSVCSCQPWHVACASGLLAECPQCAKSTVVPWNGKITAVVAPERPVDLAAQSAGGEVRIGNGVARLLAVGSKVVAHFAGRKRFAGWYDATIVRCLIRIYCTRSIISQCTQQTLQFSLSLSLSLARSLALSLSLFSLSLSLFLLPSLTHACTHTASMRTPARMRYHGTTAKRRTHAKGLLTWRST